ncbi:hypothetical protein DY000_02037435 [Brassica cretica]|uniref:Lsm14-like N-terminal domain-containing protein n=1 Tax=Brassica cretica TaxID=69181 RepID=A0ABQ7BHI1_BRACR|nr:hypothetical protein DY000_02037435 [Brassica cretica]
MHWLCHHHHQLCLLFHTSYQNLKSYIGSFINLVSNYKSFLRHLNPHGLALGLQNVICYGTENNNDNGFQVPPYVVLKKTQIKKLIVTLPSSFTHYGYGCLAREATLSKRSPHATTQPLPFIYSSCNHNGAKRRKKAPLLISNGELNKPQDFSSGDLNGSWVGAQLPWSVGDVVLGRSSSGSSNLRSDLDSISVRSGWVGAQLPWSVGDVVLGRSSSGSSNLRSDLDSISVRSGSDPPWKVRRKQSVAAFVSLNFPIEIFRSMMLKANRGFAGDFFRFGFWLQQAWWLCAPPVDLEFSNSSVL